MITTNVIQRVFLISFQNLTASSFTVEKNNKQYLATVRHLFKDDSDKPPYSFNVNHGDAVNLSIFHDNQWKNIKCTVYFHEHIDIDIAVLEIPFDISPRYNLVPKSQGLLVGQSVYFLGFPFEMFGDASNLNRSFPFPFVKHSIITETTTERTTSATGESYMVDTKNLHQISIYVN